MEASRTQISDAVRVAAERLSAATGSDSVILFGSRARGDNGPESDWDLAVLLPEDITPQQFTPSKLWKMVADLKEGIQVFPIRKSVFEANRHDPNSVSHGIATDGVAVIGEVPATYS